MKFLLFLTFLLTFAFTSYSNGTKPDDQKPKLIVGIVIDQMRFDYLTRYWNHYGEDGFKKLVREGHHFTNTHFNYVPTYTGPGHASIYSGTTPAVHGIISNNWYDRNQKRVVYVTEDPKVTGVGTTTSAGKMSPRPMITTTISDELRIASNMRSKVIGVALKDRGAILPAGHSANAAYWYEGASGNWVSSSWYFDQLPEWTNTFNRQKRAAELMKEPWKTLKPADRYVESTADDTPYEDLFPNETKPVFPHDFPKNSPGNLDLIKYHPAGNTITKEFALAAMKGEKLGEDEFTDLLAISFSTPDYVGHQFGTHAIEIQDIYLRLDLEIADMIKQIESAAGKENVLFFLTADHAAIPNPLFLRDRKVPAGIFNISRVQDSLSNYLSTTYGAGKWVLALEDDHVYLDHELIRKNNLKADELYRDVARLLMGFEGVAYTLTLSDLISSEFNWGIRSMVQKGYYPKRSGDVVIILEPGLIEYKTKGTTHGSAYTYDTHVPLIFYGKNIKSSTTVRHIDITDIAPTLSQILGIQPPNGTTGKVIGELFGE
jgi:predicted AlkP superfamily pyrophosphatase or phosphodiesterase